MTSLSLGADAAEDIASFLTETTRDAQAEAERESDAQSSSSSGHVK